MDILKEFFDNKLKQFITINNIIWFIYFLSIKFDTGKIIILLFILAVISFFSAAIYINENYKVSEKYFGRYLILKIIYFFLNVYLIRFYHLFYFSYFLIIGQIYELYKIKSINCENKSSVEVNSSEIKKYYKNLFLMGFIIFSIRLHEPLLRYPTFVLMLIIQIKKLEISKRLLFVLITLEISCLIIYEIYSFNTEFIVFIISGLICNKETNFTKFTNN